MSQHSVSALARIEACGGELVFPSTREEADEATSYGTVVHTFLAEVSQVGVESALESAPEEHREQLALINVAALPACRPDQYAVEVAFAYNWRQDRGRELGRSLNRRYQGLGPDEIAGTADVLGVTEDSVIIHDYKSGWARLGLPQDSLQLVGYAVAAARAYGRERAVVGFIRRLDGDPIYQRAELDALDLDAGAARIRALMERPPPDASHLVQGPHCRYCPAFGSCPAKMALAKEVIGEGLPTLTNETAPRFFERLVLAEQVLERVRGAINEWARSSPIHLPGGQCYGLVEVPKESLDPELAAPVLAEAFSPEVASAAVQTKAMLTKTALSAALRAYMQSHPGLKITKLEQSALERLRAAGAAKTITTKQLKIFTPKVAP